MDFSLDEIDTKTRADDGVYVPLLKLDGETPLLNALGAPVQIKIHGADSDVFRKASREMALRRVSRSQKTRGQKEVTASDMEAATAEELDLLVAVTCGWKGVLDSKDKPIPFTAEGARELFTRFPVAREQCDNAIHERTRFTKGSSAT